MPRSSARRSRNIRPCSRVGSSAATSTCTAKLSGRITRGACWAAGGGGAGRDGGDDVCCVHASAIATINRLRFTFDLHFARDEIEFFRVVAERAERHVQQLRGL